MLMAGATDRRTAKADATNDVHGTRPNAKHNHTTADPRNLRC
jgi:hypothetical protein